MIRSAMQPRAMISQNMAFDQASHRSRGVTRAKRPQTVIRAPRTRQGQEGGAAAPAGTAAHETRPGGDAGLVGKALPAASADPDGRDQGLVRRTGRARHLRVRHWITSFPLLHLRRVMTSRAVSV